MHPPQFLYFDLGNVLVKFDSRRSCRQMAEVAGVSADAIWNMIFETDLQRRYETGQLDDAEFYESLCVGIKTRPDFASLVAAASDIFTPNWSIFPVVAGLAAAGHRLGILSNTGPMHWNYCARYALVASTFHVRALSYQLGAWKPSIEIFQRAANLAGVAPRDIFFVDDIAGHVEVARQAGFDAVQYTTTPQLVADLRARSIEFNY